MNKTIKFKRGTAQEWLGSAVPSGIILSLGEPGFEKDTGKLKIGDGFTPWAQLPYVNPSEDESLFENLKDVLLPGSGIFLNKNQNDNTITIHSTGLAQIFASGTGISVHKNTIISNATSLNATGTLVARDTNNSFEIHDIFTDNLSLNTTNGLLQQNIDLAVGQISWNTDEGTIDYGLNIADKNISHHIGQELFYRVHNNTGNTIYGGMVVYASGAPIGHKLQIAPFIANGSVREIRVLGIALSNIENGADGYVTHFGYIKKIDTTATDPTPYSNENENWSVGDILYADPFFAGKLTKIEPKHSISIAIVTEIHKNNGRLFVRPTSYGHLSDNHDVNLNTINNGDFLQYNADSDSWVGSQSGNFSILTVENNPVITGLNHIHGIANANGVNQFNFGINENIRFSGINGIGINFDSNTKTIAISGSTGGGSDYSPGYGIDITNDNTISVADNFVKLTGNQDIYGIKTFNSYTRTLAYETPSALSHIAVFNESISPGLTPGFIQSMSPQNFKIAIDLNEVENTRLSTWPGSNNLTVLGNIANFNATNIFSTNITSNNINTTEFLANNINVGNGSILINKNSISTNNNLLNLTSNNTINLNSINTSIFSNNGSINIANTGQNIGYVNIGSNNTEINLIGLWRRNGVEITSSADELNLLDGAASAVITFGKAAIYDILGSLRANKFVVPGRNSPEYFLKANGTTGRLLPGNGISITPSFTAGDTSYIISLTGVVPEGVVINDIVYSTGIQSIGGYKTFESGITVKNTGIFNDINVSGTLNLSNSIKLKIEEENMVFYNTSNSGIMSVRQSGVFIDYAEISTLEQSMIYGGQF